MTGYTFSSNFPTTFGAHDTCLVNCFDVFVTSICVTATVRDALGNRVRVTVRFTVMGSVHTSGSESTDAAGQAGFCYTGPDLPGADTITR